MDVEEIMTRNPVTCFADDKLDRAAQLMWEHDVGAIPVIDGYGAVIGMLTDRDACMAAYTQGRALSECSVASAMSQDLEACTPSTSVALAEERMRYRQVRRLPVVENGKLVGIVSLNDLALAALNRKSPKERPISQQEIATTLARISEHRSTHSTH
jgi:CBS domain-containing protein